MANYLNNSSLTWEIILALIILLLLIFSIFLVSLYFILLIKALDIKLANSSRILV
jgi:hypothetical protein